jgi:hypothetical protein
MDPPSPAADSDSAILSRLIRPERDDLSPDAARSLLKLEFEEQDRAGRGILSM